MPALHVRNVDDWVVRQLKERARRNHRSLEGELRAILETASREDLPRLAGKRRLTLNTVHVGSRGAFSRDAIYDDDGR